MIYSCGIYNLICGERKKASKLTHNRPQILRRLRKEEFNRITEREIYDYLTVLEQSYAVSFDNNAKASLVSTCRDRQSGGLGNFIEIIELIFSYVRPEWEDISYQIIKQTGRILHTHSEEAQSFTGIKPEKANQDETIAFLKEDASASETDNSSKHTGKISTDAKPHEKTYIDVAGLPIVTIDLVLIKDALRHKITM